jgi:hypothetical protein
MKNFLKIVSVYEGAFIYLSAHVRPIFYCYSNMSLFAYRIRDVILETSYNKLMFVVSILQILFIILKNCSTIFVLWLLLLFLKLNYLVNISRNHIHIQLPFWGTVCQFHYINLKTLIHNIKTNIKNNIFDSSNHQGSVSFIILLISHILFYS